MTNHRERGSFHTQEFQSRTLYLYTPPSYGTAGRRYPVVYVNDPLDYMDAQSSKVMERLEQLFREERLPEVIIAGVEPINRLHEYTPWPAKALVEEFPDFGGEGLGYLSFITQELKPYIDSRYKTEPDAAHTAMIGASLGGLISMVAAYEHPDVFGKIGLLSASFWYEGMMSYIQERNLYKDGSAKRVYMYVGDQEGVGKQTIQSRMIASTEQVYDKLVNEGLSRRDLRFVIGLGGHHLVSVFEERFTEALEWLWSSD
ncbi:alpha/beta hydrolase [Paenibacillus lutrae]|uniref:alpha/beta hydrolase n=1 Tax=Paenibacillus lutrae TaxID=2078573 RepID=UPI001EEA5AEB|nr:alpha/beta hydrolase-fold protein [Paenibacillus lutrae]